MAELTIKQFKGLRNDEDQKQVPIDYFYKQLNFNYSDTGILGIEQVLNPKRMATLGSKVDGIFEYRYLDSTNNLMTEYIGIANGSIYKNITTVPIVLKAGLSTGKVSFVIFNDKLYMANGKDYVNVYDGNLGVITEMGAPAAVVSVAVGNPNGVYSYKMTYTTTGGEEIVGSISNTVTALNRKVTLNIPIGYSGVTDRKIYRTVAGGATWKLVAAVGNNTALTYTDDTADGALGANIGVVNNELPKPFFLTVSNQKLVGAKVSAYPTQIFITGTNVDVFDAADGLDISNYGSDNTPVTGVGNDFNMLVVGTNKNIYLVDVSGASALVSLTRANIGILDGYSIANIPSYGDFAGGVMFVSTQYDVRLMTGLNSLPVATSLDNVRTQNWAQNVKGTLTSDLTVAQDVYGFYYKYKYLLIVDAKIYTFDIRTNGWSTLKIKTENYISEPEVFGIFNEKLYNGQKDGYIELQYSGILYREENVNAYVESPLIDASDKYKFISSMKFYFIPSSDNNVNITVSTDTNDKFNISADFRLHGGDFDAGDYSDVDYNVETRGLDYRTVNINRPCRWLKYILTNSEGTINYQGFTIVGEELKNSESVN
jgi:hypothetical protein